ncbi:hypothetical protein LO763_20780 [Glycomyces sp. A-F 0318]|uniref:hypothetical protein n=1 Tax=Glycomyces amatae TaxID=2881355 RepID=UPI001E469719|nr:hypothetical protein [Glycomyces amatae]MCD0446052.1 hypothetical protein [Glycomyces amatae]
MPDSRTEFAAAVTAAADRRAREVLAGVDALAASDPHHRAVMGAAKALVACAVNPASEHFGSEEAAAAAARLVAFLAGMQAENGLFDGENFASPPDTAFTVNDLCDTYALLERSKSLRPLAEALERIAGAAAEPLRLGGVHTPNHRWELSAALARLHRHWPDERLVARVDEWLAEGVDIGADGWYSERSANYALHVSNPSLTAIGAILGRPELLDGAARSLEAIAAAALPDGTVETVHSRRQDQRGTIALAPFLMQFRRYAIQRNRGDFAAIAAELEAGPIAYPADVLAEILLEPALAGPLPKPEPRGPGTTVSAESGLAVVQDGDFAVSVYGGSDYAKQGRIRSGLATNPTFLRVFAGEAVLDSVRLSRDFFGLGPFRAEGLEAEGGAFALRERVSASYYGPLPAEHRRPGADYALVDEGRFSAAMDFAHRPAQEVALETKIRVEVDAATKAVRLKVEAAPGRVRQVLELAFREGGEFEGVHPVEDGFELDGATAAYRRGGDRITIEVDGAGTFARGYHPGEDYTHLSGTDAAQGVKLYVTVPRTGRCTVVLRAG